MRTTTFEEFGRLAARGGLIPVCGEVMADLLTPVSAFLKIAEDADYAFLFESVTGGEQLARYSFLGKDPFLVLTSDRERTEVQRSGEWQLVDRPLGETLDATLGECRSPLVADLPRLTGGAVGCFGGANDRETLASTFMLFDTVLAFDHVKRRILLIANARVTPGEPLDVSYQFATARLSFLERELDRALSRVVRPAEEPAAGQTASLTAADDAGGVPCGASAFDVYRSLRFLRPAPYMFFLRLGSMAVAGASHDMLVRIDRDPADAVGALPPPRLGGLVESLSHELPHGAVGYLDFAGNLDFCRATQALVIDRGLIRVHAGPFGTSPVGTLRQIVSLAHDQF